MGTISLATVAQSTRQKCLFIIFRCGQWHPQVNCFRRVSPPTFAPSPFKMRECWGNACGNMEQYSHHRKTQVTGCPQMGTTGHYRTDDTYEVLHTFCEVNPNVVSSPQCFVRRCDADPTLRSFGFHLAPLLQQTRLLQSRNSFGVWNQTRIRGFDPCGPGYFRWLWEVGRIGWFIESLLIPKQQDIFEHCRCCSYKTGICYHIQLRSLRPYFCCTKCTGRIPFQSTRSPLYSSICW